MKFTIFVFVFLASEILNAESNRYDLRVAINLKKIQVKALSLGGFQGYCVKLQIKNLTKENLIITIEPGTRLISEKESDQDILIVRADELDIRKKEVTEITCKGYCCEASNNCPDKGSKFSVANKTDLNLVAIAKYLNVNSFDSGAEQHAVWSVSDNRPTAAISAQNDSGLIKLRHHVAFLKNEPIPWYTYETTQFVYSNGVIEIFPQRLKGSLIYSVLKEEFATLIILDENLLPVGMMLSRWLPTGSGKDFDFNLPIKGFKKGKYTARLQTRDAVLADREFII